MAQYKQGTASLSFGEIVVTGIGTAWLSQVTAGDMILVGSDGPAGIIASVQSDTELRLEQAWPGPDAIKAAYAIHRDFDPTTGAPLLAPGDAAVHLLVNRAITRLSVQTASAVAGLDAVVTAQAARDAATAAASAVALDAAAVAADRGAVIEDKWTVVSVGNAAAADRTAAQTAATAAAGHAGTTAADRTAVAADKAATATALAQAQALVGTAGTGTATGLVYAGAVKNLVTASDVVAVHVYDTAQDSDGGAWTQRCRDTSWYNEPLNTATRGATRRFPKVALIVARATNLTIYDAHDLDGAGAPRMWMVFTSNSTATQAIYAGGGINLTAVTALNGRLWVTSSTAGIGGVTEINFPADISQVRRDTDTAFNVCRALVNRNTALPTGGTLARLIDDACVDVVACVLPGAPLDRAGLPIPTVVVICGVGLASVIHPWGAVYDVSGYGALVRAHLTARRMYLATDGLIDAFAATPYADVTLSAHVARYSSATALSPALATLGGALGAICDLPDNGVAMGGAGLTLIAEDTASPTAGMTAFIAAYATGWMPGDIRGAWLCDTVTGKIVGSGELVANGAFTGGTTGWAAGADASLAVISTELQVTGSSSYNYAQQVIATVVGQTYVVTATLRKGTSDAARLSVYSGVDVGDRLVTVGTGTVRLTFQAQSSTTYVSLTTGSTPGTAHFSAISVKLGLTDRSHKTNGLVVNGTLSRTALGSGGLAALNGFSGANYLEQPYNPDLDFGTGDFAYLGWVNSGASGTWYASPLDRGAYSGGSYVGGGFSVKIFSAGTLDLRTWEGADVSNVTVAGVMPENRWTFVVAVRRNGKLELWVDGVLVGSANPTLRNVSNPSALLRIGYGVNGYLQSGSVQLALARITTTAPTPAQIRKMYADERPLIAGGMPATLGGTSSNVATLALDTATGLLHVGTADGISQFDGLVRTSYLDAGNSGPALASDNIVSVSAAGGHLVVATNANVGYISDPLIARDRMAAPVTAPDRSAGGIQAGCVTADANPTDMAPRLYIGEREAVTVDVTVMARTHGASATHSGSYRRLARYVRDAGGNVTLTGSIQTIGTDQQTSAGMAVTLQIDTAAQTVTPRVTGVAGTRLVWTARINVTRIAEENDYDQL